MTRLAALLGFVLLLAAMFALSLLVGSNPIPAAEVWRLLLHPDGSYEALVITEQRLPRSILVVVVGAALAVAVVGVTSIWFYLWFAFAGAALAALLVSVLGATGRSSSTPVRLALAGIAISMAISSLVQTVILSNQNAYNEFRLWAAGSAEGRGFTILGAVLIFVVVGLLLALTLAPALNALALGDETGKALGVRVQRTRILVMVAVTLLAGAATAAIGPIGFVGLGVPYLARAVCGPDQRWVLPFSAVLGPALLLGADILGRVILAPQEVQVGIIAAILGGPVFILIARRRRIEAL